MVLNKATYVIKRSECAANFGLSSQGRKDKKWNFCLSSTMYAFHDDMATYVICNFVF
jgi:hypothetical protein